METEISAVQVGHKFWCTRLDGDGHPEVILATPGMGGAIILPFPNFISAWTWAAKKMDDKNGNKFQVVQLQQAKTPARVETEIQKPATPTKKNQAQKQEIEEK